MLACGLQEIIMLLIAKLFKASSLNRKRHGAWVSFLNFLKACLAGPAAHVQDPNAKTMQERRTELI